MTPLPLKFPSPFGEGLGVRLGVRGGVSILSTLDTLLRPSVSVINITDPTPIPSPAGAGRHHVQGLSDYI